MMLSSIPVPYEIVNEKQKSKSLVVQDFNTFPLQNLLNVPFLLYRTKMVN